MQLALLLSPQSTANPVRRVGHNLRQHVRIAGGHADLGVSQDPHHDTLINSLRKQERGRGVPGVMEPGIADASGLE